jgi:uncharacterized membrane protein
MLQRNEAGEHVGHHHKDFGNDTAQELFPDRLHRQRPAGHHSLSDVVFRRLGRFPDTYLPFAVPGFGLIVALLLITLIGFLAANIVGRAIVNFGERLLGRMPLVRGIYRSLKQIFETVLSNQGDMFKHVGMVEYPRKDVWSLVFLSGEKETEINEKLDVEGDPLIAVFMPCTPNPTTGFLMYVRKSEIVLLDMSIEEGARLIVSAGLVAPKVKRKRGPDAEAVTISNPKLEEVQPARSKRTASSLPNK